MDFSINLYNYKDDGHLAWRYDQVQKDCLVIGVFEDYKKINQNDERWKLIYSDCLYRILDDLYLSKDFHGHVGETVIIFYPAGMKFKRLLFVGLGLKNKFDMHCYLCALDAVVKKIKNIVIKNITCTLVDTAASMGWNLRTILHTTVIAYRKSQYDFFQFKTTSALRQTREQNSLKKALGFSDPNMIFKDSKNRQVECSNINEVIFPLFHENTITDIQSCELFISEAQIIADAVNLTCNIGNAPSNICTPSFLAKVAQDIADAEKNMTLEVFNLQQAEMKGLKAFTSVAKGSKEEPRFIVMQYRGANTEMIDPIVLVGKGVTFDSGGISLKPGENMDEMRYDMSGAGTVLGVMQAASQMKLALNIVGIIPACENMPSGNSLKPGDIIESLSGKTIEVLNTDAEGRLILCDALTYAESFSPRVVIDIATLTGACVVALGHYYTGLFSNVDELAKELLKAGEESNDICWRLPIHDVYQQELQSNYADIANIGGGRVAGAITAACFLSYFSTQFPWAHLDIAGTAWQRDKTGATGRPVCLLISYLLNQKDSQTIYNLSNSKTYL